jgi:spoIIIJ-associated protein
MTVEWVEVKGPSVEVAVEAALAELGIESREEVDIEVLQEPEKGFLGIGRTEAVVRVKPRPKKRRRSRSTKGQRTGESRGRDQRKAGGQSQDKGARSGQRKDSGKDPDQRQQQEASKRGGSPEKKRTGERPPRSGQGRKTEIQARETTVSREEQASVVGEFLEGLLNAFGLEGSVATRVEEDIIYADVSGSETEALVGSRGVILQSIHELAKTVVQRKTQESARIRLDIAGYAERRREALKIYAQRLGQQVLDEGGEVMVEPMNAAERKVIHDTVSEIEGVRTYSEGEEPRRSVVIAAEE